MINCSWKKFKANILNVSVFCFNAKFWLEGFDFSSEFHAPDIFAKHDLNCSLIHKSQQLNSSGGSSLLKNKWKVRIYHFKFY